MFLNSDFIQQTSEMLTFYGDEGKNRLLDSVIHLILNETITVGSIIKLSGDLGSGKTTFARNLIKFITNTKIVPSPTFSIAQVYDVEKKFNIKASTIWHFDFYRATTDMSDAINEGISIVEWIENANFSANPHSVSIYFLQYIKDDTIIYKAQTKDQNIIDYVISTLA
ncbi:tRNA (adenosine(37)-N6)-threonylcarbamoyltransferase complex ATPase subunit type 1 TsaE [Candidatus Gromoviella agglomerans]|uniref:tRNA (adenosine(37)-N6)-threonylcarbamoyltransferase complex ATPase subunit type 1 TsaE n=1 Tax=Candidatus Gromoviella agglomerans TaxID=2806609 RepID=UPI001E5A3CAC|nr:tRNA (adenosine(37)-N6)-threonylcarbamoyltransferase complex ATPase subunit type 1 TsaE [Candidatus Gromoviella agglomerans]UFX98381.1 tRNA threonylcarbamoyladenosine biosynthesis protein TsaE [Candidatus Gromoviella agglomerans]